MDIDVDKSFGSKWLVNHPVKLGFSILSDEVLRYKESAIEHFSCHSHQINQDKGMFHGMGRISVSSSLPNQQIIPIKHLEDRKKNPLGL